MKDQLICQFNLLQKLGISLYLVIQNQGSMNSLKTTNDNAMIFKLMSSDMKETLDNDPWQLECPFILNNCRDVVVILTQNYIILAQNVGLHKRYTHYANLEFSLKFQIIYTGQLSQSLQNSILSKKIGFKLLKENHQSVEFKTHKENMIDVWIKYLSRVLNQCGFHELYKPIKKLGKGAFAIVYEVERLTDQSHFAVKAFSKQNTLNSHNPSKRQNLINQITMMRKFNCPNIIHIEGVFQSQNSLYVVLQLLSAGQLHTRINKRKGIFSLQQIKQFMIGMTKGLIQMNKKRIMHRDIKPENIMMRNENGMDPVIVDFGLAADVDANDYLFYRCGTAGYVAPEITTLEKGQKIEPICDVFSVGVIFHILLTKRPLFQGRQFQQVYSNNKNMKFNLDSSFYDEIDPNAINLLQMMLRVKPRDRITAEQMLKHPFLQQPSMMEEHCCAMTAVSLRHSQIQMEE